MKIIIILTILFLNIIFKNYNIIKTEQLVKKGYYFGSNYFLSLCSLTFQNGIPSDNDVVKDGN
jgi:uncharacterized membrane protein YwzB